MRSRVVRFPLSDVLHVWDGESVRTGCCNRLIHGDSITSRGLVTCQIHAAQARRREMERLMVERGRGLSPVWDDGRPT